MAALHQSAFQRCNQKTTPRRQPAVTPPTQKGPDPHRTAVDNMLPRQSINRVKGEKKRDKCLQASLSPSSVAASSWEPCAQHASAQWWCQQLWWASVGLGFSFLSLSSWFQFYGAPGWGILLLPPADQSTSGQSKSRGGLARQGGHLPIAALPWASPGMLLCSCLTSWIFRACYTL